MKITWLGQAGFLFETGEKKIVVDPYLSDSVAKLEPHNYRRVPVDERFLRIKPDVIVITHNHADHLDKETLKHYISESSKITVLAPYSAWTQLKAFGGLKNNYISFNEGSVWTENGIEFYAVKAEHSDPFAIGIVICAEGKNYYVTGDTLYNEKIFASLPKLEFEAVFLPVNGKGNNMNFSDAERFARRVNAKYTVPCHIGLFDNLSADYFTIENKLVPEIYKEIKPK